MVDLVAPTFIEPIRPIRMYYLNTDSTSNAKVSDRMSDGKANVPVVDEAEWSIEVDRYKRLWSKYDSEVELWKELQAQGFALVLQHSPDELEAELRNQEAWENRT